jgi:hypothetical protein
MAATVYMETWGTIEKQPHFKRRLIKSIHTGEDSVNGIVEFMRVDTDNGNNLTYTRLSVVTVKKKYKFNGYTGVHIRNDGAIRWFSDTMAFDNPIFKWTPVGIHTLYNCVRYNNSNVYKFRKAPIAATSTIEDDTDDDTGDCTYDDVCSSLDVSNTSTAVNDESSSNTFT